VAGEGLVQQRLFQRFKGDELLPPPQNLWVEK
jgi:hypothetical protein